MTAAILILFAGYSIGSYGVVLVKGYNITLRQWLDPLDPYVWPSGGPLCVPPGQIFPTKGGGVQCKAKGSAPLDQGVAAAAARNQGRPNPDSVQSRF